MRAFKSADRRYWSETLRDHSDHLIVDLPDDIWRHIASFMDGKTAQRSARVSRVLTEQARLHEDLVMPPLVLVQVRWTTRMWAAEAGARYARHARCARAIHRAAIADRRIAYGSGLHIVYRGIQHHSLCHVHMCVYCGLFISCRTERARRRRGDRRSHYQSGRGGSLLLSLP